MASYRVGDCGRAGLRLCNEMKISIPSLSVNEGMARAAVAAFCVCGGFGCNCVNDSSSSSEPSKEVVKPELENLNVDASEKPTAWFIGDYKLKKIEIDGVQLNQSNYKIANGYCILKTEYYGNLGVGNHEIKIYFTEGVYEFNVSVKDDDVIGNDIYNGVYEFNVSVKDSDVIGNDIYNGACD